MNEMARIFFPKLYIIHVCLSDAFVQLHRTHFCFCKNQKLFPMYFVYEVQSYTAILTVGTHVCWKAGQSFSIQTRICTTLVGECILTYSTWLSGQHGADVPVCVIINELVRRSIMFVTYCKQIYTYGIFSKIVIVNKHYNYNIFILLHI